MLNENDVKNLFSGTFLPILFEVIIRFDNTILNFYLILYAYNLFISWDCHHGITINGFPPLIYKRCVVEVIRVGSSLKKFSHWSGRTNFFCPKFRHFGPKKACFSSPNRVGSKIRIKSQFSLLAHTKTKKNSSWARLYHKIYAQIRPKFEPDPMAWAFWSTLLVVKAMFFCT